MFFTIKGWKKCISAISRNFGYAFFGVTWKKMHIRIFQKNGNSTDIHFFWRKRHVFVAQTLAQKMHEHLSCFLVEEKMHIGHFWKIEES